MVGMKSTKKISGEEAKRTSFYRDNQEVLPSSGRAAEIKRTHFVTTNLVTVMYNYTVLQQLGMDRKVFIIAPL